MKVLHLCTARDWRGGEQQIAYLHEELLNNGINSIVACPDNSTFHGYATKKQLPYILFPFRSAYDLQTIYKLVIYCHQNSVDVVHLHTSKGHTLGLTASLIWLSSKLVLSRRVDFPVKSNWFSKFKYNHRNIRRIICVSDAVRKILINDLKEDNKAITVYDGIDFGKGTIIKAENLRERFKIGNSDPIIGNISAIADHKDYFTFVNAAELVLREIPNAHFFIVGEGPLKTEVENYITEKGLNASFILTGFVTNPLSYLKALDVLLFTSKTEGLGSTILDAMKLKIPIVATNAGGIPEVVKNEVSGLLSQIKDHKALSHDVIRTLNDKDLREELCKNASRDVLKFSKEIMAQKTIGVYCEILGF